MMNTPPARSWLLALLIVAAVCFMRSAPAADLPPPLPPPPALLIPGALAPVPAVVLGAQFAQGMRIQEFARVVLVDVLRAQFVFSSDFLSSTAQVGFSARNLKKEATESLLRDVLHEHGFEIENRGGYYRVNLTRLQDKPDLREDFVYHLKFRDLAYISSQVQPLFPQGSFTYQRSIDSSTATSGQTNTGGAASVNKPQDSGGSLYSMSTRPDSDLLYFRGVPSDIKRLKTVLSAIDTPVPQVLVRAFVLETTSSSQSGYSVASVARLLSSRLGISVGGAGSGASLTFKGADFEAVASALQADNSVRVLTAPSIFAENGVQGSVIVGNSVPVLGSIQTAAGGQTSQSISNVDTGVILRITPHIYQESIGLQLEQELSDAIQTETGVRGSPTITKRSLRTSLNMSSGDWVVLGGVTSVKSSQSRESLPFWRSITLGRGDTESRSDIVIVLNVQRY